MPGESLVELLKALDEAEIPVWLDGGWGVDALLRQQTRPHKDVDLIPRLEDVPKLREVLGRRGYSMKEGSPPDSFILADGRGLEVDIHAVAFDGAGNGIYRMENGQDWVYPADGFTGEGSVGGLLVRCLSPKAQVLCHAQGYEPTEKDIRDMGLLEAHFRVELPPHLKPRPEPAQVEGRIRAT
jgi:lincosamide nucleotidyltransferase A/C/D/E